MPASALLLALTTATDACGAAVWRGERLEAALTLHRPRRHSGRLVPLLRDALAHAEVEPEALDAVALAAGPGSYTGLRIGASTAKGLCRATGAALVPVPTLAALAETGRLFTLPGAAPDAAVLGAVLRSRRGEVYAAAFRHADDALAPVFEAKALSSEEAAGRFHALHREHGAETLWLLGSGAARVAEALPETERAAACVVEGIAPTASAVARLGAARLTAGTVAEAASFEPRYLKPVHVTPRGQSVFEGLP